MASAVDASSDLAVLVCSANVGNAEPTPESFGRWVPDDGSIEDPLASTRYPVEAAGAEAVRASLLRDVLRQAAAGEVRRKFDLIVLGMQEAAFVDKSFKQKKRSSRSEEGLDGSLVGDPPHQQHQHQGASHPPPGVSEVVDAVNRGAHEVEKQANTGKNKMFRKAAKMHMIARGLASQETYKAPELMNPLGGNSKVKENSAVKEGRYDTRKFIELIQNCCPSYKLVTSKLRGEMRLIVLALKDLEGEITDIYTAGENTGIGGVMANKGGIIATFTLRGTRLSFMTAHLEAHEGLNHYTNRNKHLVEIFQGAKTDPNYNNHDATIISHHMFVCGDLNYRIRFGDPETPGKKVRKRNSISKKLTGSLTGRKLNASVTKKMLEKLPSMSEDDPPPGGTPGLDVSEYSEREKSAANGSHFDTAKALVDNEDWKALNEGDELAMALKKKECLVGFNTLPCNFPPTFKVARGEGYHYNEKRTPSYTDRILWKSADGMADNVVPFIYEPCPDFITSDHKPIRGAYMVKTNLGRRTPQLAKNPSIGRNDPQVHLLVTQISARNLPKMDAEVMGGLSDPYILFVSYPSKSVRFCSKKDCE
ncbi:hypothetical protein ACHAWF_014223 [Thalassiosira exigua]